MTSRRLIAVGLLVAMVGFGFGVNKYLGTLKNTNLTASARKPSEAKPRFTLPGTVVVAQGGALYRFHNGTFTQIANGGWTQATVTPDHQHIVAVKAAAAFADIYELSLSGQVTRQITSNSHPGSVEVNHWSFYPHVSPDGGSLYYSYDQKDFSFRVDLTVFSMPYGGTQRQAKAATTANQYTGGDVQPVPLGSGQLLYVKYDRNGGAVFSQLWLEPAPNRFGTRLSGKPLTTPHDDCLSPALSPAGDRVAMICTTGSQVARLVVAPFDGNALGPATTVASGTLAAPAWAPDGKSLVYYQGIAPNGHFQLMWLNLAPPPSPAATSKAKKGTPAPAPAPPQPKQITTENDFDATSPPVWWAG